MKTAALIPAAGSGSRLGHGPKAYVEVGGLSLLGRSVAALAPYVDEVIVALPAGMELPPGAQARHMARVIVGGATRQASVQALLEATQAQLVLIHDAARPFLPPEVIRAVLDAAQLHGAATAALPVADTLVAQQPAQQPDAQQPAQQSDGQHPDHRLGRFWGLLTPREGLWAVQTPQGFDRALLLRAHRQADQDGIQATDDAGLVARLGLPVALIPGDARLFKVTTPGDLALARALAPVWDER